MSRQVQAGGDPPCAAAGRIFEFVHGPHIMPPIITSQNLQQIKDVLLHSIRDEAYIAEKVGACEAT